MPTSVTIYPYNLGSGSARALANSLGIKRIRQNGAYRWRIGKKVINWGNTRIANWMTPVAVHEVLNKPANVELASDKIQTLRKLNGIVPLPDWSDHATFAAAWLNAGPKWPGMKHAVLCRTLTRANSGRGIVLATSHSELVPAPLYTRYVPKQVEYRIHVFKELGVIDMQQKRRSSEVAPEGDGRYIRNHDAGWVFCRENVHPPESVIQAAIDAVNALGLDFGAVDIGFHTDIGPCVYEVNTAPGLEGQTLSNYVQAFKQIV